MQKKNLYNYEKQYRTILQRLEHSKLSRKNKEIIKKYDRDSVLKDKISLPTLLKYYSVLIDIATNYTKKDFDKLTKEDFEKIVEKVNKRDNIKLGTKQKYWAIIKKFGKWLAYGDQMFNGHFVDYPDSVSWINTCIKSKDMTKIRAGDILTEEEIELLINATDNVRDKAFLSILYETGARMSELGLIRIKDISEHQHGYLIDLSAGKTGERTCIVVFSSSKLSAWLNQHPNKEDKDAPVWCALCEDNNNKRHRGNQLSYRALHEIVRRLAIKTGLHKKKRIHPHLFRHSRVTHLLANRQINEAQCKVYFGWAPSSKMLANYSHLTSSDANKTMLQLNGIEQEAQIVNGKRAKVCQNCHKPNDDKDKFCGFCSKPLDFKTFLQQQQKIDTANKIIGKTGLINVSQDTLKEVIRDMIKSGEIEV